VAAGSGQKNWLMKRQDLVGSDDGSDTGTGVRYLGASPWKPASFGVRDLRTTSAKGAVASVCTVPPKVWVSSRRSTSDRGIWRVQ